MALRIWFLLSIVLLASQDAMAVTDNASPDINPGRQDLPAAVVGQPAASGGTGTYHLEAGEWVVDLQGPTGLTTRTERQPEEAGGEGFYTMWLEGSADSYAAIFIVDYASPLAFTPESLRQGLDLLLSPYQPAQVLTALRTIDGNLGAVAEAFSQSHNKTVYAVLYPVGAGQDNTSSVTAGLVSLLDRDASLLMMDTLRIQPGEGVPSAGQVEGAAPSFGPLGSQERPVPLGTPVDLVDGWQIRVLRVITNATDMVMMTDPGNEPPRPGFQYFIASIEGRYYGPASSILDPGLRLRALGSSQVAYRSFDRLVSIPDPLPRVESFPGGLVTGNVCWEIRSSDADSLLMFDQASRESQIYLALFQ